MRFLQIVTSQRSGPPDPAERAEAMRVIREELASGAIVATGGIGKRATVAARVRSAAGAITVEDPPAGEDWMSAGGYRVFEAASKDAAIARAKKTLELMGDGVVELIEVSPMHPPTAAPTVAGAPTAGVIPYLSVDGADEASRFYQKAFGAVERRRMAEQNGARLMHCHLEINGGSLMLCDHFPEMGAPPVQRSASDTMQLVVADGDRWWARAIAAGCTQKLPFELAPWGDRYGQLVDPFGVTWALLEPGKAG